MTDSFDGAMTFARKVVDCQDGRPDGCVRAWCEIYDYGNCEECEHAVLDRLQEAYDHDMDMVDKSSYHRGHEDGQRSMDAEHYAVALRLRRLRFDGGSHENLNKLAYAIYPCATGWTCESCDGLRDELIRLMGGVHDEPVSVGADCGAGCADCDCGAGEPWRVTYDVLGNERHEAVCELRRISIDALCDKYDYVEVYPEFIWAVGQAVGLRHGAGFEDIVSRLIHLLTTESSILE